MDAGLACPDWPLCNNSVVPNLGDPRVAVEYAHRLVAALTSLFVVLTMALAVLWHRSQPAIVTLSVVTIHLALGTATLALALMVALLALRLPAGVTPSEPSVG